MTLELIKKQTGTSFPTRPGNTIVFLVSEERTLAGSCVGTALTGCLHNRALSNRCENRTQKQAKSYGHDSGIPVGLDFEY